MGVRLVRFVPAVSRCAALCLHWIGCSPLCFMRHLEERVIDKVFENELQVASGLWWERNSFVKDCWGSEGGNRWRRSDWGMRFRKEGVH